MPPGIEGDDEFAVFMDPAVFGDVVIYTPAAAPSVPVTITGILTAPYAAVAGGPYPGAAQTRPVLSIAATALADPPADGDTATLRGVTWRVADPQPDGTGLIRLTLERN